MAVQLEVPGADDTAAGKTVFVYEAPVRLWHWINALAITVLALTGYLIASPLPSMPGEASDNFVMGYIFVTCLNHAAECQVNIEMATGSIKLDHFSDIKMV